MLGEDLEMYRAWQTKILRSLQQQDLEMNSGKMRRNLSIVAGTNERTFLDWSDYDAWRKLHWEYGSFTR